MNWSAPRPGSTSPAPPAWCTASHPEGRHRSPYSVTATNGVGAAIENSGTSNITAGPYTGRVKGVGDSGLGQAPCRTRSPVTGCRNGQAATWPCRPGTVGPQKQADDLSFCRVGRAGLALSWGRGLGPNGVCRFG